MERTLSGQVTNNEENEEMAETPSHFVILVHELQKIERYWHWRVRQLLAAGIVFKHSTNFDYRRENGKLIVTMTIKCETCEKLGKAETQAHKRLVQRNRKDRFLLRRQLDLYDLDEIEELGTSDGKNRDYCTQTSNGEAEKNS